MIKYFLAVLILYVTAAIIIFLVYKNSKDAGPALKVLQATQVVVVTGAIVLAGAWYFVERRAESHARLGMEVTSAKLHNYLVLLEVKVSIENLGTTVLLPSEWDVRIRPILPSELHLQDFVRIERDSWPEYVSGNRGYYKQEIAFHTLRRYVGRAEHEVEPGETDIRVFDFVLSCEISALRASVAVEKPPNLFSSDRRTDLWWLDRVLVSLDEICAAEPGTVLTLSAE